MDAEENQVWSYKVYDELNWPLVRLRADEISERFNFVRIQMFTPKQLKQLVAHAKTNFERLPNLNSDQRFSMIPKLIKNKMSAELESVTRGLYMHM